MSSRFIIYTFLFIFSTIGSVLPLLWGEGFISISSIVLGGIGGIFGVWLGFKVSQIIGI